MNNFPKRLIICGSGNSVQEGIDMGLYDLLAYEYTVGMNYWYKYACSPTINGFVDFFWYYDNLEEIKSLPLIIGAKTGEFTSNKIQQDNTILLPFSHQFHGKDSWKKGFYKTSLSGFFFLTLGIALDFSEIFLLGYDSCQVNGKTHFYQDEVNLKDTDQVVARKNRGIGLKEDGKYKSSHYNSITTLNNWFSEYNSVKDHVKIYNVSQESKIDTFEKISYNTFFNMVKDDPTNILQTKAREKIKSMIEERI